MSVLRGRTRAAGRQRGQSLAELAIGFTVLVLLASGLLDLGRTYFVHVALEDGAGEAALFLSINPNCVLPSDGPQCADPNNAMWRARYAGGSGTGSFVDWSTISDDDIDVSIINTSGDDSLVGDTVRVTITYQFPLLTPIIPQIAGANPIPLRGEAVQFIVKEG